MKQETPENMPNAGCGIPDPDYQLLRLIGHGSYGEVWLVRDKSGIYRACKIVHRQKFDHDRPYEREFAGIQKFEPISRTNDNQIKILHVGRRDDEGYFYYIMELADDASAGPVINPETYTAKTIKTELRQKGRLAVDECIRIGLSLVGALDHLHGNNVIHRDIKPANVIFVNGVPKLADIGLLTDSNWTVSYVGTEGFIPPEGPTSPQADIYGLGKVLYEMSSGRDRLDFPELPADFESLPDREALLEFNAVVTKACETDIRRRYQSAKEIYADLVLLNSGKSVRRKRLARQRQTWLLRLSVALAFLCLATASVFHLQKRRQLSSGNPQQLGTTVRFPIPDEKQLTRRETEIKNNYRDQLSDGRAEEKLRIAKELLTRSVVMDGTASQMAALRVGATLAVETGNFQFALELCDKLAERFLVNALDMKLEMLAKGTLTAETSTKSENLVEACIATGFVALGLEDFERATKFVKLSRSVLQHSSDAHLINQVEFLEKRIAHIQKGYRGVEKFMDVLRNNSTDLDANLEVGKFLCFVKNDWDTGLPMLTRGRDEGLKRIALDEIVKSPVNFDEQASLGQQWWNLVESAPSPEKDSFRRRARFWFLKAIANAKEPNKSELKQQFSAKIRLVPVQSGTLRIFSHLGDLIHVEIYSNEIRWMSRGLADTNKMNHIFLGSFKKGETKILKNCGATCVLPEGIDFSTARLTFNYQSRKSSKASLDLTAEDHVTLRLLDPEAGFSDLDVSIVFGD